MRKTTDGRRLGGPGITLPTLALAASTLLAATGAFAVDVARPTWRDAQPSVTEIVQDRSEEGFATPGAGTPQARRLQQLLDKAVDILAGSQFGGARSELRRIAEDIAAKRKQIADWRFQMAGAPEGDAGMVAAVLKKTFGASIVPLNKGDYRSMISGAEEDIRQLDESGADVRRRFAEGLRATGVSLSEKQIEGLMSMVTAEDLVAMQAAFDNMKSINQELMQATIRSDESLDVAKSYYGVYTVLLEIAVYMHEEFLEKVDKDYLKRLDRIVADANALKQQSSGLQKGESDPALKKVLAGNLAAQDLTIKAAGVYRERLMEQRAKVQVSLDKVSRQFSVARNTYRTVELNAELVSLLKTSSKQFDQLMQLEIPALRPFESIEMKNEFEKISDKLRVPTS